MKFGKRLLNFSKQGNMSNVEINFLFELQNGNLTSFVWKEYYETILQTKNPDEFFIVLFKNRDFFANFPEMFFEKEDFETIANYISLNILYQLHIEQRWKEDQKTFCLTKTKTDFSFLIAAVYQDLFKNQIEIDHLKKVFNTLKDTQIETIRNSKYYSTNTKINAIKKTQTLEVHIGYLKDPIIRELIDLIENFKFGNNYYENNIASSFLKSRLKYHHSLSHANNTIQPLLVLNPIIINASYNRMKNSIQLNAAGLRPPLYDPRFPYSVLYGASGQMIAHEMSHVFDTDSLKVMENNDPSTMLWAENDLKIYNNRAQCFIDQYNQKQFPEVNLAVNGSKTLCENIADNGGLLLAFKAYKNIVNQMTFSQLTEEVLPYTEWTHLQTFFIAHAQKYCATYFRRQFLDEFESTYSFMKLRVNVPLENSPDFAKAFNCPADSKMNPKVKCSIF